MTVNISSVDYEMVLKLEPDNTEAQNEIKKIREVG